MPAARALEMFNREGLNEIDLAVAEGVPAASVVAAAKEVMARRATAAMTSPSSARRKC
jgi:putative ABC transport system permease protein